MLDSSRLNRLTDWTLRMHRAGDFEALAEVTLAAVSDLVPCEWPLLGLANEMPRGSRLWRSPHRADWDAFANTSLRHETDDPVYSRRLRLELDRAATSGEFVSEREISKTELYNQAWRPLGITWFLNCLNPGVYGYRLCAARSGGEDFTGDEVALFNAIARNMDAATERLVRDHHGRLPVGRQDLPIVRCSWIVCDRSGVILRTREDGLEYLRECLGPRASTDRVPAAWLEEYERRLAGRDPRPQRYHRAGRGVAAYVAPIRGAPGKFSVYFVEQARARDALAPLVSMGLSPREAEVLKWITEGKTNPEVGIILGISELTAKKHVENILHKLGVSTRTAAVARAIERMQTGA